MASGSPAALLRRFKKVRVLVVGDLVADHYVYGQTERVSREAPVLIVRHQREEVKLGGAANAAANAAAMGGRVTALGVMGDDLMAAEMLRLFSQAGVAVTAIGGPGVATEAKTRVLAGGVSTRRQQMLRIDRGAVGPLPADVRQKLAKALAQALAHTDVAIVSDYGAGVLCDETRAALTRWAGGGGTVCVDSRFGLGELPGATVCKPNEPELEALTGMPVSSDDEVLAAGLMAMARLQCQVLLVTRGRKGSAVFTRGGAAVLFPPYGTEEAVDVTGAGDTVIAAFALAIAAGAEPAMAAHLANVAGALKVRKAGTATVSFDELRAELSATA